MVNIALEVSNTIYKLPMYAAAIANQLSSAASQALEAEWDKISETEKTLSSIDCSSLSQLCKDYDIISYPTIRFFDGHGTITPYRGPRTSQSWVFPVSDEHR